MGNGSNRLHLNSIHLLKRMIENTRCVDGLKSKVLVVEVSNKQTLGCESIGLNIDIRSCHALQKARLSDIGVSADEESSSVGVNGRKTTEMLAHLVEVEERILQSSANSRHTTQGCTLELFTLEEGLCIFEKSDIIARHDLDQMLRSRELAECNAEVVCIVEGVEEILVERVDILESRKAIENQGELLSEGLLCEFDFPGVEICDLLEIVQCL